MTSRKLMLEKWREFTKDSAFTEEDALRLGREVSAKVAKRYNYGKAKKSKKA